MAVSGPCPWFESVCVFYTSKNHMYCLTLRSDLTNPFLWFQFDVFNAFYFHFFLFSVKKVISENRVFSAERMHNNYWHWRSVSHSCFYSNVA